MANERYLADHQHELLGQSGPCYCTQKTQEERYKASVRKSALGARYPRKLKEGKRRHEWKVVHGFRKFYKTHAEQVMKPINVEITMGHNIGISSSYYRPQEKEVFSDYLNAVDLLSINDNEKKLQSKVSEIEQRAKEDGHAILKNCMKGNKK